MDLDSKIPSGPLAREMGQAPLRDEAGQPGQQRKYTRDRRRLRAGRRFGRRDLAELGYKVMCFCYQDSPRRAHSIAAQGGINAAKNYQNDGDSIYRLFYDTVKGGDFRSREANVYRLAQVSVNIIDQCVAQGAVRARVRRSARQPLLRRRPGVAHVLLSRSDRPATSARRLPGLAVRSAPGSHHVTRHEMLDLIVIDGRRAASSPAIW